VTREEIDKLYHDKYYSEFESPYGTLSLDIDSQLDLSRGALSAMRHRDDIMWSHPLRLRDGTQLEMCSRTLLYLFDLVCDHLNGIKRDWAEALKEK
jgi:hypothetical protein